MFDKPSKRNIKTVWLHCSLSDSPNHDDIKVIKKWHLQKGQKSIGYHYFIKKNGELQLGRNLEFNSCSQCGYDDNAISICISGLEIDMFTEDQFNTLTELCYDINQECENITFHGHREITNTICPVFDYKELLQLDDAGKMTLEL